MQKLIPQLSLSGNAEKTSVVIKSKLATTIEIANNMIRNFLRFIAKNDSTNNDNHNNKQIPITLNFIMRLIARFPVIELVGTSSITKGVRIEKRIVKSNASSVRINASPCNQSVKEAITIQLSVHNTLKKLGT